MTFDKNYREYILQNGLRVALKETQSQTVGVKLRVNYGAVHELAGEDGFAHFLEHCLVTGGSSRYSPQKADEIKGVFGVSNACTNIGRTFFFGNMLPEDLPLWLDYTADHVFNPRLDLQRMNEERERVIREISDAKSNSGYHISKTIDSLFYRGHPKGRFVLGDENTIACARQEDLRHFHQRGFSPNNMELIVAGNITSGIEESIDKYFGSASSGKDTRIIFPELSPLPIKSELRNPVPHLLNKDNPQNSSARLTLIYPGPVEGRAEEYPTRMMNHLLGGDYNSHLFQDVSLRKGLAYEIAAQYDGSYNAGILAVQAKVPASRINESIDAIFDNIQQMKCSLADEQQLKRLKKMARYRIANAFETNDGHISAIETRMDEKTTPQDFMQNIESVEAHDVMVMAQKYLPDKDSGRYILSINDPLIR